MHSAAPGCAPHLRLLREAGLWWQQCCILGLNTDGTDDLLFKMRLQWASIATVACAADCRPIDAPARPSLPDEATLFCPMQMEL